MKAPIFVVEDNPMYSMFIKLKLDEKINGQVNFFTNAEEAIAHLHYKPKIIIMDYMLGNGMNGLEAIYNIKRKLLNVPIIMVSSQKDIEVAIDVLKAGVYSYIVKDQNAPQKIIDSILDLTN